LSGIQACGKAKPFVIGHWTFFICNLKKNAILEMIGNNK